MKQPHTFPLFILATILLVALAGCGRETAKKGKEPVAKDVPSFKEGKGLWLPEATRQFIGLEVVEVSERKLAPQLAAEIQVYEATEHGIHASGVVSRDQARLLKPGQRVSLETKEHRSLEGRLSRLDEQVQSATGQAEVLIEIPASQKEITVGTRFTATFASGKEESVTTIPRSALVRAAEGDFVYVVNGERLSRTAVVVGAEFGDLVEIKDGLYSGDKVAIKPAQTLWLTELRFVKGGAACAD